MSFPRNLILSVAAATFSALTFAQASPESAPADIGVSPRTAEEALQQAVPREDTATVTSTGESPPVNQEASQAQERTIDAAGTGATTTTTETEASQAQERTTDAAGTEATTATTTEAGVEQEMRGPRADRN